MENTNLTALEAARQKAAEIGELLKTKVHPIVFKDPDTGKDIVGYLKEPSRLQKIAVMDKMYMSGAMSAASELYEVILLREYSDPRLYSENPEDDSVVLGGLQAASDLIKFLVNQFSSKKKN